MADQEADVEPQVITVEVGILLPKQIESAVSSSGTWQIVAAHIGMVA
ncbi:MAG: hypothetical protein HXY43_11155 [Fischerella sp.]|jgi:hypothetical protein|nr:MULTISPECIES: hypothetical protein [unclassified Fischerella]NWF59822.1 hypothetical protein [Fischerella sp.]